MFSSSSQDSGFSLLEVLGSNLAGDTSGIAIYAALCTEYDYAGSLHDSVLP